MPESRMDNPLPELDFACTDCGGSGSVVSPTWNRWRGKVSRMIDDGVPLKDVHRRAGVEPAERTIKCRLCDGRGRLLTTAGGAVIKFLKTWLVDDLGGRGKP